MGSRHVGTMHIQVLNALYSLFQQENSCQNAVLFSRRVFSWWSQWTRQHPTFLTRHLFPSCDVTKLLYYGPQILRFANTLPGNASSCDLQKYQVSQTHLLPTPPHLPPKLVNLSQVLIFQEEKKILVEGVQ